MSQHWYTRKWANVSLHVLFWALFFAFPYLLRPVWDNGAHRPFQFNGFYYLNFFNNLLRVVLFYFNAFILIPRLIYHRRFGSYAAILMGFLGLMLCWDWFFYRIFITGIGY